jgi:hypothetical protein
MTAKHLKNLSFLVLKSGTMKYSNFIVPFHPKPRVWMVERSRGENFEVPLARDGECAALLPKMAGLSELTRQLVSAWRAETHIKNRILSTHTHLQQYEPSSN